MIRHRRLFFAVTHGINLVDRCTLEQQYTSYRLRSAITESDIVFAAATFIGMPFETNRNLAITGDKVTMNVSRISIDSLVNLALSNSK